MRLTRVAVLLLLPTVLSAQSPQSQPQFRTAVDVVRLDVGVFDRGDRPVHGLQPADFTVLEDGRPQEIVAFKEIRLGEAGGVTGWLRDVSPDVQSNQAALDGRVLVIVMDDAVAPIQPEMTEQAKALGRSVVDRLGPADQAAVVFTLDNSAAQGLTTDRGRLLAAIDAYHASVGFLKQPFALDVNNWNYYEASIRTLTRAADLLAAVPDRRKALVYISVGLPVDIGNFEETAAPSPFDEEPQGQLALEGGTSLGLMEMQRDLQALTRRLFDRALRSNVAVYGLDPAGLRGLESVLLQQGYGADEQGLTFQDARARANLYHDFLGAVAANTGGTAVTDAADYERGIDRVFADTGSYYLIGYRTDPQRTRGYRRVQVRVNRDDVTVRARTGFDTDVLLPATDETETSTEATLARAMAGLVPESELPMAVNVLPFARPGERDTALAIVARLRQRAPDRRRLETVELRVTAFEPEGRQRGSKRQRAELALLPGGDEAEYEVLTQLDLRPGRYSLRMAGHSPYLDDTGSVYYDIDVPDYARLPLAMSGLALTASPGVPAAPRDALEDLLPILPTTQRTFDPAENVTAFLRLYQLGRRSPVAVRLEARVLDADRAVVVDDAAAFPPDAFADGAGGDYRLRLPVDRLPPGAYVLMIEAGDGETVITRMVPFAVAAPEGEERRAP